MTVTSKVRLYDLAKELKLDTKRLIEEIRREGVDVNVPSNSVSKELADKIRNKYFPKKATAAPRAVRVVKRAALPAPETEAERETDVVPEELGQPAVEESAPPPEAAPIVPAPSRSVTARLIKKPAAVRAEQPTEVVGGAATATSLSQEVSTAGPALGCR